MKIVKEYKFPSDHPLADRLESVKKYMEDLCYEVAP